MGTFSTDVTLFLSFFLSRVQSSDFSDITNWPTPGEIANKEVRKTLHFNINLAVLYAILFSSVYSWKIWMLWIAKIVAISIVNMNICWYVKFKNILNIKVEITICEKKKVKM